ncbi:MAG TPA: protein kinase, partial [Anaerolineales bacterium]|nr:protein kinase [Anaerolineales bacterium]
KIIGGTQHTATGAVVGTALYMAPEIIKAESVDKRVDIYSLGVTLYETLTGKPPYQADSAMSLLMMHVNDPIPDLKEINPEVPAALVSVVEKALAKDKEDRFQSAAEFARALRSIDLTQPDLPLKATSVEQPAQPMASSMVGTMVEEPDYVQQESGTKIENYPQTQAQAAPVGRRGPTQPPGGGKKSSFPLPLLIGGGIFGLIVIIGIIFLGARVFGAAKPEETPTLEPTPVLPTPTIADPTATTAPTNTPAPTLTPTPTDPAGPFARINSIHIEGGYYIVEYETFGYTEELPGVHIHFFFNNITPENAGSGGTGPWYLWGGPRPFNGYAVSDRPADATQICALQANANHTVNMNTGNCVDIPSE